MIRMGTLQAWDSFRGTPGGPRRAAAGRLLTRAVSPPAWSPRCPLGRPPARLPRFRCFRWSGLLNNRVSFPVPSLSRSAFPFCRPLWTDERPVSVRSPHTLPVSSDGCLGGEPGPVGPRKRAHGFSFSPKRGNRVDIRPGGAGSFPALPLVRRAVVRVAALRRPPGRGMQNSSISRSMS